jgi:hypothetical protein
VGAGRFYQGSLRIKIVNHAVAPEARESARTNGFSTLTNAKFALF